MLPKDIKLIILFGSQASGSAGKNSDTDIAVLADHELGPEEKMDIGLYISKKLSVSEDKIDMVDLWNASPLLQHQAGETGKLLYGKKFDFVRFRVLAWKRYQDTAKFRRIREERLKRYSNE